MKKTHEPVGINAPFPGTTIITSNMIVPGSLDINNPLLLTFLMKVQAYYSKQPWIEVYHNSNKCTEGNNIEYENRRSGTGNRRLCDHCKRLD